MNQAEPCPKCGVIPPANAPWGICPRCLIAAGLESQNDAPAASSSSECETFTAGQLSPAESTPPTAAELSGHFPQLEILELLGYGGMGVVYKARQLNLDRMVALKIIRPATSQGGNFAKRFNREAKTLARLSHPSIITIHDFGQIEVVDGSGGTKRDHGSIPIKPIGCIYSNVVAPH